MEDSKPRRGKTSSGSDSDQNDSRLGEPGQGSSFEGESVEGQKKLPTSAWGRVGKLTVASASVGLSRLGSKIGGVFADELQRQAQDRLNQVKQAQKIVSVLSEMRGAAMKLGQILSLHGEHLFSPEVAQVLSQLQSSPTYMDFSLLEPVLLEDLGENYKEHLLTMSSKPVASASIGQVYKACLEDGRWVAVKVQFPGVDQSIDSDVETLSKLMRVVVTLPRGENYDDVIAEIRSVLHQETNYALEAENMAFFRQAFLSAEPDVIVPEVISALSTKRVLVTEFSRSLGLQEWIDRRPSQELRNHLGQVYLRVFYRELFEFGRIQTDPNFGNYRIDAQQGKLVLLDFGAVQRFDGPWRKAYLEMIRAAYERRSVDVVARAEELGFLRPDDPDACRQLHIELCELFMEPLRASGTDKSGYDFGASDLPKRMRALVPRLISTFDFRPPPKQILFLNRKMIGTYFFLSKIGAKFDPVPLLKSFLF